VNPTGRYGHGFDSDVLACRHDWEPIDNPGILLEKVQLSGLLAPSPLTFETQPE
jgi:hypothetical protein